MVHLLHLCQDWDGVVKAHEIKGHPSHPQNVHMTGVSSDLPMVSGQVVDGEEACCPHLGKPVEVNVTGSLGRISDRWHLCFPEATKAIRGDQHTFMQLYLVPHTCKAFQEGLKQFGGDEVDALGRLGLDYCCSVYADGLMLALEQQLLRLDPKTEHLHVSICVDSLPLVAKPGEVGSCTCGGAAALTCSFGLCEHCCSAAVCSAQGHPGEVSMCARCNHNKAAAECMHGMCGVCCKGCTHHTVMA